MLSLLATSCGRQSDAENLVKDFISQHATNPDKIVLLDFSDLDSTKLIKDSVIQVLQERENPLFKKDISYAVKTSGRMLYFLRTQLVCEGDTLRQTFYLDEQLQQVVAIK
jgi:hypothetical protein